MADSSGQSGGGYAEYREFAEHKLMTAAQIAALAERQGRLEASHEFVISSVNGMRADQGELVREVRAALKELGQKPQPLSEPLLQVLNSIHNVADGLRAITAPRAPRSMSASDIIVLVVAIVAAAAVGDALGVGHLFGAR